MSCRALRLPTGRPRLGGGPRPRPRRGAVWFRELYRRNARRASGRERRWAGAPPRDGHSCRFPGRPAGVWRVDTKFPEWNDALAPGGAPPTQATGWCSSRRARRAQRGSGTRGRSAPQLGRGPRRRVGIASGALRVARRDALDSDAGRGPAHVEERVGSGNFTDASPPTPDAPAGGNAGGHVSPPRDGHACRFPGRPAGVWRVATKFPEWNYALAPGGAPPTQATGWCSSRRARRAQRGSGTRGRSAPQLGRGPRRRVGIAAVALRVARRDARDSDACRGPAHVEERFGSVNFTDAPPPTPDAPAGGNAGGPVPRRGTDTPVASPDGPLAFGEWPRSSRNGTTPSPPAAPHRLRQPADAPLDQRGGRIEAPGRADVRRRNLRADRADASESRQALSGSLAGTPATRTRVAGPPTSRSGLVPGTLQTHRPRRQTRPREGTRVGRCPAAGRTLLSLPRTARWRLASGYEVPGMERRPRPRRRPTVSGNRLMLLSTSAAGAARLRNARTFGAATCARTAPKRRNRGRRSPGRSPGRPRLGRGSRARPRREAGWFRELYRRSPPAPDAPAGGNSDAVAPVAMRVCWCAEPGVRTGGRFAGQRVPLHRALARRQARPAAVKCLGAGSFLRVPLLGGLSAGERPSAGEFPDFRYPYVSEAVRGPGYYSWGSALRGKQAGGRAGWQVRRSLVPRRSPVGSRPLEREMRARGAQVTTTAAGEIRTVAWRLQGRARPPRTRLACRPACLGPGFCRWLTGSRWRPFRSRGHGRVKLTAAAAADDVPSAVAWAGWWAAGS